MPKQPGSQELLAWIEGQQIANRRVRQEVSSLSAAEKLRQISRLMASAPLFNLSRRETGDDWVRELWRRLRSKAPGP